MRRPNEKGGFDLLVHYLTRGRISRSEFRLVSLLNTLGFCFATGFLFFCFGARLEQSVWGDIVVFGFLSSYLILMTLACIKRLHDLGESGWELLPHHHGSIEEWKIWLRLFNEEGTPGANDFGEADIEVSPEAD